ncbi:MAG TPA: hypothetical protein VK680_08290 [Solirubrobacteraceae bacterium]|nr:hypothetical protein [Solirubrobacteraceae bacterium]
MRICRERRGRRMDRRPWQGRKERGVLRTRAGTDGEAVGEDAATGDETPS